MMQRRGWSSSLSGFALEHPDFPDPVPDFCGRPAMPRLSHAAWQLARASALWLTLATAVSGDEPAPSGTTTPPSGRRGWIEPQAASSTASPKAGPPATLRLPSDSSPIPIGTIQPDLPPAADFDQQLIAAFTKEIQPLVLNRCASGRCHGGPDAEAPRFVRRGPGGTIDRELTLTNIEAVCSTLRSDGDPARFMASAASPHGGSQQPPLTPPQLKRLAVWIDAALAQRKRWLTASAASFEEPVPLDPTATAPPDSQSAANPAGDNRFRRLLEQAGNPDRLPPPQTATEVIDFAKFPEAGPAAD
jgi:hypothetical protein